MKTHTVFTLMDGQRFDEIEKALNHCEEIMGAEMRAFLTDCIETNSIYKQCLKIVIDKKYDKAFKIYMDWRKEHDELLAYKKQLFEY